MTDERKNLPSASGIDRLSRCPGSWQAEQLAKLHLPPEPESKIAAAGTLNHEAYAGDEEAEEELDNDGAKVVEMAKAMEAELLLHYFGDAGPDDLWRERRLWMSDEDRQWCSGQFDLLAVKWGADAFGLILDLKTGWDDGVPASWYNRQLRTEAVIAWRVLGLKRVGVGLIEPRQGKPTIAEYDEEDLAKAEAELLADLRKALDDPSAPRAPGSRQCKYCKAAGTEFCPESQSVSALLAKTANVELMDPSERGRRLELLQLGMSLAKKELDLYKRLLTDDANAVAGWKLSPGGVNKPVTNTMLCYQQAGKYLDAQQFVNCCKVTKTNLTSALREATGTKGRALDAIVETVLDGCVTEKPKAARLERIAE